MQVGVGGWEAFPSLQKTQMYAENNFRRKTKAS